MTLEQFLSQGIYELVNVIKGMFNCLVFIIACFIIKGSYHTLIKWVK